MFGEGFFGGEVFDELDDLETLPGREFQKRAEQAEAVGDWRSAKEWRDIADAAERLLRS